MQKVPSFSNTTLFGALSAICIVSAIFLCLQNYVAVDVRKGATTPRSESTQLEQRIPSPCPNRAFELQLIDFQYKQLKQLVAANNVLRRKLKKIKIKNDYKNSLEDRTLEKCDMETCFNYNRCSISSRFFVYVYPTVYKLQVNRKNQTKRGPSMTTESLDESQSRILWTLLRNYQTTMDPAEACVFIALAKPCEDSSSSNKSFEPNGANNLTISAENSDIRTPFEAPKVFKHWGQNGANHLIWLQSDDCDCENQIGANFEFGSAMIVSRNFKKLDFRPNYDFVVGYTTNQLDGQDLNLNTSKLPPLLPARRRYLATYIWSWDSLNMRTVSAVEMAELFKIVINHPSLLSTPFKESQNQEKLLLMSTFSLIILNSNTNAKSIADPPIVTSDTLQRQLYTVLKNGAIPIVIGAQFQFPFSEFIDWAKVALTLPFGRLSELPYILKNFSDSDIITFKRNRRRVFTKYLKSLSSVIETLLAGIRTRIGIPPIPYETIPSPSAPLSKSKPMDSTFDVCSEKEKVKHVTNTLGPLTESFASPKFVRNVTSPLFLDKYELWNVHFQPFRLLPSTPWDLSVPPEAQVTVAENLKLSSFWFWYPLPQTSIRPAFGGDGASAAEFSKSLGGNLPAEQFTIVILTYKRETVLMGTLKRLVGLPYLNSVVVVWNDPAYPSSSLLWPEIGVPVNVIKAEGNSLNNRFRPYDVIETDAILSLDDDVDLRHEEIIFAFRVWRENRERLVGLPGRFHGWDVTKSRWRYDTDPSCEISMVLTGAAFFHKYYAYMYTFEMPTVIRKEVDRLMNCEDLAMNFLISYLTQKPPIKVTGREQFPCPSCTSSLFKDKAHYDERDSCINTLSDVYGYTTLLYTQYRADSIQYGGSTENLKCFRNV